MKELKGLRKEIDRIMEARYLDPTTFESFAATLVQLGIVRLDYDCLINNMVFYVEATCVGSWIPKEITKAHLESWTLAKTLSTEALEEAIYELDNKLIPPLEFHRKLFEAGVSFCHVFLREKKIFYFDQNANFYLENYK